MDIQTRRDLAARVLMKAAACDNRKLGTDDERQMAVAFWAEALHPETNLQDAMNAVTHHYATTSDYLMPAHINKITARYRRERLLAVEAPYPPGLGDSPRLETEWRKAWHRAVQQGASADTATRLAWGHIDHHPPREITSGPSTDIQARIARLKQTFGRKTT